MNDKLIQQLLREGVADESAGALNNDIRRIDQALRSSYPWFAALDEVRQAALIHMAIQIGLPAVAGLRAMLNCIRDGHYHEAETHAMNSAWAHTESHGRAHRVARQIATGEWQ